MSYTKKPTPWRAPRSDYLILGLTGSIGSGKSTVGQIFEQLGAIVIDADRLARAVVAKGTPGLKTVIDRFGAQFLQPDGTLDRQKLGALVFSAPTKRRELEAILHPLIRSAASSEIQAAILKSKARAEGARGIILYVVPLLFEVDYTYPELDGAIVVDASEATALGRVTERDNLTLEEAAKRLAAQIPPEQKRNMGDFTIPNNGSIDDLKSEVEKLYHHLRHTP